MELQQADMDKRNEPTHQRRGSTNGWDFASSRDATHNDAQPDAHLQLVTAH